MARLIDVDKLKKRMCFKCNDEYSGEPCEPSGCVFCNAINDAPTVDAVEVVRCRDCKHLMFSDFYPKCKLGVFGIVMPDDFCCYGERTVEANELF